MQTVITGSEATFELRLDSNETPVEEVRFEVVKSSSVNVYGPFFLSDGHVTEIEEGYYTYTVQISPYITPGFYHARWMYTVDGILYNKFEEFSIIDPPLEAIGLLDQPSIRGVMRESPNYREMGNGQTDRLFLIGHGDGLQINTPYEVLSVNDAINVLGADADSPLLRGMLEAYNAGCRDIWLVATAPMSEYILINEDRNEPKDEWDGLSFYERYAERLETTYRLMVDWDPIEILVPLEASFYGSDNDFLIPLVAHCAYSYQVTGSPRIGVIGTTLLEWSTEDITAMAEDSRLDDLPTLVEDYCAGRDMDLENAEGAGKFVLVTIGQVTVSLPQVLTAYTSSAALAAASVLATSPVGTGLPYKVFPSVAGIVGRPLTKDEIDSLVRKKLNPVIRTPRGKRGIPFQIALATDNLLAPDSSDYWSVSQLRLVSKVLHDLRRMGNRSLGTIGYPQFKAAVNEYMIQLVRNDRVRGYDLNIVRDQFDVNKVIVEVTLYPHFGIRELFFVAEVGPGA